MGFRVPGDEFVGIHGEVLGLVAAAVLHKALAGIPADIQLRVPGQELAGKGGHAHDAARHGAGHGADAAALQHVLVFTVHTAGNGTVLAGAAGRKTAVHVIVQAEDLLNGAIGLLPFLIEHTGLVGLAEGFQHLLIMCTTPVAAGAVAAVMADVERLVSGRNRRLGLGEILIGAGVHARTEQVVFYARRNGNDGFAGSAGGQRKGQGQQQENTFHRAYSLLKINTQLIAATIPVICHTVGRASISAMSSSTIDSRQQITGEQASASGAMTMALP